MTRRGDILCCLDCEDRFVGCHSKCDRYETERKVHLETLQQMKEERRSMTAGYSERLLTHKHINGKEYKKGQP